MKVCAHFVTYTTNEGDEICERASERLCGSISLKGGQEEGDDVRRDAVAVSGRDVAQAEHQERQQEKQAGKLNLSQNVPKVSLDMLKAPAHVQKKEARLLYTTSNGTLH